MKPHLPTPTLTAALTFDIRPADAPRDKLSHVAVVHDVALRPARPKQRKVRIDTNRRHVCTACHGIGHNRRNTHCPAREENKL